MTTIKIHLLIFAALMLAWPTKAEQSATVLSLKQFYHEVIKNEKTCQMRFEPGNFVEAKGRRCPINLLKKLNRNWNITNLLLRGRWVKELPNRTFENLKQLRYLELHFYQMNNIEDRAFYGLHYLESLIFVHNDVVRLSDKTFEGLTNLKKLAFVNSRITSLQYAMNAFAPSMLPNLKYFDLSSTPLKVITAEDFKPLSGSSIEHLKLSFCTLAKFDVNSLKYLPNLKSLDLRGNDFLENESIKNLLSSLNKTNIEHLDLSKLQWKDIPANILKSIPSNSKLITLALDGYKQNVLSDDLLPYLPKLTSLSLDSNSISKVEPEAFKNVPLLMFLSIGNNNLNSVPKAVEKLRFLEALVMTGLKKPFSVDSFDFSNNQKLVHLDFSGNLIKNISGSSFPGADNLQSLILADCQISLIAQGAFKKMKNLTLLIIDNNPGINFDVSSGGILPQLENLRSLSLNKSGPINIFEKPVQKPFKMLKNLEELDLTETKISKIESHMFFGLKNLKILHLQKNLISNWHDMTFSQLSNLTLLNLSSNAITGKKTKFIFDLDRLSKKTQIDLAVNPFSCSCKSFDFINWIQSTTQSILGLHTYETFAKYSCDDGLLIEIKSKPCVKTYDSSGPNIAILFTLSVIIAICLLLLILVLFLKYRPKSSISKMLFHMTLKSTKSQNKFKYDAFISYSSADHDWISDKLVPQLENDIEGMKLCIYERDFLPGHEISSCILESLENSKKIIMILTNNFIKSQWCLWEVHMANYILAEHTRDDLVIVLLEELDPRILDITLEYLITTRIHLVWSKDAKKQEIFWTKLKAVINGTPNPNYAIAEKT